MPLPLTFAYRIGVRVRRLCPLRNASNYGVLHRPFKSFGGHLLPRASSSARYYRSPAHIGTTLSDGLMRARSGAPHHASWLSTHTLRKCYRRIVVTSALRRHGIYAGKQWSLRSCWPDRLIGELPKHLRLRVTNPSDSYANDAPIELILLSTRPSSPDYTRNCRP